MRARRVVAAALLLALLLPAEPPPPPGPPPGPAPAALECVPPPPPPPPARVIRLAHPHDPAWAALLLAVCAQESGCAHWDPAGEVVRNRRTGALGAMQIHPGNWPACGGTAAVRDLDANLACGEYLLRDALRLARGDVYLALRIYNGGPRARRWRGGPTHAYAREVLARVPRGLVLTRL